jgi:hypothetical protein
LPADGASDRRAVVVHGRADVARAARIAAERGCPVTLLTAPGAADYAGPDVLMSMIEAGLAEAPGADVRATIDCGDAAGRAQAALRAGWRCLVFTGHADARLRLQGIAEQYGACVLAERPVALDPLDRADAEAAIRAWLAGPPP